MNNRFLLFGSVFLVVMLMSSCGNPDPNYVRAKQLLIEINEIADKPVDKEHSAEVMKAMQRLYEAKTTFPANRDKIIEDAKLGREFFASAIEGHNRIIPKFEELTKLPLSEIDLDCIRSGLDSERAQSARLRLTLDQIDLYFDMGIDSKEALDYRSSQMRKDAELAEKNDEELAVKLKNVCSKSKLGIKQWSVI